MVKGNEIPRTELRRVPNAYEFTSWDPSKSFEREADGSRVASASVMKF